MWRKRKKERRKMRKMRADNVQTWVFLSERM